MKIVSYLTFNGNCREAMTFYQNCLGGELHIQTLGETPMSKKMPRAMRDYVLHSTLRRGPLWLMASDMVPQSGLLKGNSVSLSLNCSSEKEVRRCYEKLSQGGMATHPLELTFWGALFGCLTDKYGHHWLLNFQQENTE